MAVLLKETLENDIVILTVNRPEARNALNLEAQRAFAQAVEDLKMVGLISLRR